MPYDSYPGRGSNFTFTLPLYSLPKLLHPVITIGQRLRTDLVLVKVELRPHARAPRGHWKDLCSRSLALLERCVYLDKDLVLPPMTASGLEQTFYVVASTDLPRAEIMMARIREQMGKVAELQTGAELQVSACAIPLPDPASGESLEQQVQEVAARVTAMARARASRDGVSTVLPTRSVAKVPSLV